ncbi:MAG: NAD(P)H-dependent oxidoreductase [Mangrovibacterium sp.]
MKTLIIVIHPDMERSAVNKRWIEELGRHPDKYHIHQLHKVYPDEKIDVGAEQNLVEQYDKIVFQFPFYWFNCPPFFKKWLDDVLNYGWAYGSKSGYKLSFDKFCWLKVSDTANIKTKGTMATFRTIDFVEEIFFVIIINRFFVNE